MVFSGWREYTWERSHPGWYKEWRRKWEDYDPGYTRFNERQQCNRNKRIWQS